MYKYSTSSILDVGMFCLFNHIVNLPNLSSVKWKQYLISHLTFLKVMNIFLSSRTLVHYMTTKNYCLRFCVLVFHQHPEFLIAPNYIVRYCNLTIACLVTLYFVESITGDGVGLWRIGVCGMVLYLYFGGSVSVVEYFIMKPLMTLCLFLLFIEGWTQSCDE